MPDQWSHFLLCFVFCVTFCIIVYSTSLAKRKDSSFREIYENGFASLFSAKALCGQGTVELTKPHQSFIDVVETFPKENTKDYQTKIQRIIMST